MIRLLTLLTMTTSLIACSHLLANGLPTSHPDQHAMSSPTVSIKQVRLIAREEVLPPLGKPQDPNRPIGFASIFLDIENPQAEDATVTVQKIEVRDVSNGQVQLVAQTPQQIQLRPLENATNDIHLTNKTGFTKPHQLQAVVIYQVDNQTQVIESSPVEIE